MIIHKIAEKMLSNAYPPTNKKKDKYLVRVSLAATVNRVSKISLSIRGQPFLLSLFNFSSVCSMVCSVALCVGAAL